MSPPNVTMKCLLVRKGGTIVDLPQIVDGQERKVSYHFKDDGQGNHVAIISDMKHFQLLAAIPEAYEVFGFSDVQTDTAIGITAADMTAKIADTPIKISAVTIDPVAAPAPLPEADPAPMQTTINAQAGIDPNMDIDQLRALFKQEVGRDPSAKAKPETMIAQIVAVREERAAAGK